MSQMAKEHNAVNLSQGFPDFAVDPRLKEIVAKRAGEEIHQYLPMAGLPSLLEKIAQLNRDSYQRNVDPATEILITAGATEGIFAAIQALVFKGDEVIILDPAYDCYETPVILCQAKAVRIPLAIDFSPDWNKIGNAMNKKTRMIIINNPHNPTGKIWNEADFLELENLLSIHPHVLVLSDEVYEYISFLHPHISMHQRKKLHDRCVSVSSFGKSFHITGWKIGYLIAPKQLMDEIKKVHQYLVFSVNSLAQYAVNDYLDVVEIEKLTPFYRQKRDFFQNLMAKTKFELLPCEGSYFQLASYASFADDTDVVFTQKLVRDYGVAAIPLSVFYENGTDHQLIRLCFAKEESTLTTAAERLSKL